MSRESKPAPAFPFSRALLNGESVHERRPGDDLGFYVGDEGQTVVLDSVMYEPDCSTVLTWTDGLQVVATGYGRRVRLAVTA